MAVVWVDGSPVAASCVVQSALPAVLITTEPIFLELDCPEDLTVLWTFDSRMVRSESQLIFAEPVKEGIALHVELVEAKELDRRRFDRIPVEAPVFVRKVNESVRSEEVQIYMGRSADIGLGGASIRIDEDAAPGTTLELTVKPTGRPPIRLYGVVVRSEVQGLRVAFLEPGGRTDESLERWLQEVA